MNHSSAQQCGTLYVVATPIGNLKDITLRAIEVLQSCDLIACEDTRHSQRLLQAHNIGTPTKALHQHNEHASSQKLIDQILGGLNLALVSDAGTPLISDPGFPLLQLAHEQGVQVVPIPGPSALIALLSVAALGTQPFTFHGFLPAKSQQRQQFYQSLLPLTATHVFYESAHRIMDSVEQMVTVLGPNTQVAMGRELTKRFEQLFRGSATELAHLIQSDNNHQKGEFVLAVQGSKGSLADTLSPEQARLATELKPHLPPKLAAKIVADHFDINKKQVYSFILSLK